MRYISIFTIVFLSNSAFAGAGCKVAEKAIMGAWKFDKGVGFFQEMAFSIEDKDHQFNSWLLIARKYLGHRGS
jgi:hypothetical protein